MRRWCGLALGLLMAASPRKASATVGGPETVEALGWNSKTQVAYFAIHFEDETGRNPRIVGIPTVGNRRGQTFVLAWSRTEGPDSLYDRALHSLRGGLKPLPLLYGRALLLRPQIVHADTLTQGDEKWPRFRLRAWARPGTVECVAYCSTALAIIQHFGVPGRKDRFAIAAFRGVPFEECYETQVPFLMAAEGETVELKANPQ